MEFRTEVKVEASSVKIGYKTPVMFIGSCFAGEMAGKMDDGLMPVMSNPSGVVYNPASVAITLRNLIAGKEFTEADLWFSSGKWLSFAHYTDFSSERSDVSLSKINARGGEAANFLRSAKFLFISFGTARIYRRADTGEIVSNCHKIPSSFFTRELLSADYIISDWKRLLAELQQFNPALSIIFTVSPVRHWKDGAHGNQVSKSLLFMAVDELQRHDSAVGYFPSYEILIDDLRDYRFYKDDMLHPSQAAVDYIWNKFCDAYFERPTTILWNEIASVKRATSHLLINSSKGEILDFASVMLKRISALRQKAPEVDFSGLTEYFEALKT
jgi:hypothetical protein